MANASGYMTLSQLQGSIKEALGGVFSSPVWIVAELGELKVNSTSGHCYLELVEKGSANGVPKARAAAVMWRQTYAMLSAFFSGATGERLAAGMKVLLKVSVTYHELYGLSLLISDIDPMYTIGEMAEQRRITIAKLVEDGIFDLNKELDFPQVPQRIAVVSSANAAGFQDFMQELTTSGYRFEVELFAAVMQGHGAEESIINALGGIAERQDEFDVVVLIRGGGAQSDLGFLNSYALCFHLAQFPLPLVSGLGHDKDQSIADMVSAVSVKTPTAAAGFLVGKLSEFTSSLEFAMTQVTDAAFRVIDALRNDLDRLSRMLSVRSLDFTRGTELRLVRYSSELKSRSMSILDRLTAQFDLLSQLTRERTVKALSGANQRLGNMAAVVAAQDPQRILSLGFAIVRHEGKVLRSPADIAPGDRIDITLDKGTVKAKIENNEG